jgi:hypothetical protein
MKKEAVKNKCSSVWDECKPTPNRRDTAWVSSTAQGQPFAAPCGVAPCFSCHAFCANPLAAHYFFN